MKDRFGQENVILHETGGESLYYTFSHFDRAGGCVHAVTTRLGGASQGKWASLNLGFAAGDDPRAVKKNRSLVCRSLGFDLASWTNARQAHTDSIRIVDDYDRGRGSVDPKEAFPATDGMLTNKENVLLAVFFADCVPLLFYDPKKKVIGAVHAGWRGTAAKIAGKAAAMMVSSFSSRPEDLLVGMGPAIGPCCYEVDNPVAKAFENWSQTDGFLLPTGQDKWNLDLLEANRQLLIKRGVLSKNIQKVKMCTACRNDLFFSHRKEEGKTGRLASVIALTSKEHESK